MKEENEHFRGSGPEPYKPNDKNIGVIIDQDKIKSNCLTADMIKVGTLDATKTYGDFIVSKNQQKLNNYLIE